MNSPAQKRLAQRLDLGAMDQVEIQTFNPKEPVSEQSFRALLARGRLVSPPAGLADPFSYSPWFSGTFRIRDEHFSFHCFLGNRCRITLPSGEVLVVDAD